MNLDLMAAKFHSMAGLLLIGGVMFACMTLHQILRPAKNKPDYSIAWLFMAAGFFTIAKMVWIFGDTVYAPRASRPYQLTANLMILGTILLSVSIVAINRSYCHFVSSDVGQSSAN